MKTDMQIIGKDDFKDFVNKLIKNESRTVVGVKAKGAKFAFGELNSADELRLDHDVTLLPPKKYFMPSTERILSYKLASGFSVRTESKASPLIIIGIHPYDIVALEQLDKAFKDTYADGDYIGKREESILIGTNIQNISPHAFAGSMGTATADKGFDLMLTDVGDGYAVEIGTEKGSALLKKYAKTAEADEGTVKKVRRIKDETDTKFKRKLAFSPGEIPRLLEQNYESEVWTKESEKCLKCGSCNIVCPTCFCFDVQDVMELNLKDGFRIRTLDGCLLEDFAKVATGENFRKDSASRYRHRFMRKGKYLFDRYGFVACVGCGRCSSACLPDIADPVRVLNSIKEGSK